MSLSDRACIETEQLGGCWMLARRVYRDRGVAQPRCTLRRQGRSTGWNRSGKPELPSDPASATSAWICRSSIRGEFLRSSSSSPTMGIRGSLNERDR